MEQLRTPLENFAYYRGTDGAGAAYDQETGGGYKGRQFFFTSGYIGGE
jgi:hypothetical protein